jgi:hypothetical protein
MSRIHTALKRAKQTSMPGNILYCLPLKDNKEVKHTCAVSTDIPTQRNPFLPTSRSPETEYQFAVNTATTSPTQPTYVYVDRVGSVK